MGDELKYQPNSHKFKEEKKSNNTTDKKIEKVIKGTAKVKKKSELGKFKDIFISDDAKNVKQYVFLDVLVPAIKKAVSDIVTDGISMILYGETGHGKKSSTASRVSYRSYYDDRRDDRCYSENRTRTGYSYDDIILDSRGEAEEVLSRMDELIDTYSMVSVADLYDLIGVTGNYTDNKYGWTNIRNAEVVRVREGYLLKLPKALPIN